MSNAVALLRGVLPAPVESRRGYTLFEVLIVLVIISLSIALVSPSLRSGLGGFRAKAAAKTAAAFLKSARNRALIERRQFTVEPLEKALVMTGEGGARKQMRIPEGVKLNARLSAALVFFPGGGSSGGELEVADSRGRNAFIIRVEDTGLITLKEK